METMVTNMAETEASEKISEPGANFSPLPSPPVASRARSLVVVIIVLIAGGVLFFGIRSRMQSEAKLGAVAAQTSVPSVSVVLPKRAAPAQDLILPGNVEPFISSPIYA